MFFATVSFATDLQDAIRRQGESKSKNPKGYANARNHIISYSIESAGFEDNKVIIRAKATVKEHYSSYIDFWYSPNVRVYRDGKAYGGYDMYNGILDIKTISKRPGKDNKENYYDYEYTFVDNKLTLGPFNHTYTIAWHFISQHGYLTELLAYQTSSVSGTVLSEIQQLLRDNTSKNMDKKMQIILRADDPNNYNELNLCDEIQDKFDDRCIIFDAKAWRYAMETGYFEDPIGNFFKDIYIDALSLGEFITSKTYDLYKNKYVQNFYKLFPYTLGQSLLLNCSNDFTKAYIQKLNENKTQSQAIHKGLINAFLMGVGTYGMDKLKLGDKAQNIEKKFMNIVGKATALRGQGLKSSISQFLRTLADIPIQKNYVNNFSQEKGGDGLIFAYDYITNLKIQFKGTPVTDKDEFFPDRNDEIQAEYHLSEELIKQIRKQLK